MRRPTAVQFSVSIDDVFPKDGIRVTPANLTDATANASNSLACIMSCDKTCRNVTSQCRSMQLAAASQLPRLSAAITCDAEDSVAGIITSRNKAYSREG